MSINAVMTALFQYNARNMSCVAGCSVAKDSTASGWCNTLIDIDRYRKRKLAWKRLLQRLISPGIIMLLLMIIVLYIVLLLLILPGALLMLLLHSDIWLVPVILPIVLLLKSWPAIPNMILSFIHFM
jgi:hypothetical protein